MGQEKLKSLFLPYEVEAILKIPLSGTNDPDWRYDKKGIYSVKSGYWLDKNRNRALSTREDREAA